MLVGLVTLCVHACMHCCCRLMHASMLGGIERLMLLLSVAVYVHPSCVGSAATAYRCCICFVHAGCFGCRASEKAEIYIYILFSIDFQARNICYASFSRSRLLSNRRSSLLTVCIRYLVFLYFHKYIRIYICIYIRT